MAMYKGETKIKDIYVGTEPIVKVYAGEEFCGFFTLSAYNLVANSDLLIDSNSNGIPDAFTLNNATPVSLVNGVLTIIGNNPNPYIDSDPLTYNVNDKIYGFASIKTLSSTVGLGLSGYPSSYVLGDDTFQFTSQIKTIAFAGARIRVQNAASSDYKNFSVDYIGAINITDLVSRGILPSGLTDAQYKTILDNYFNS